MRQLTKFKQAVGDSFDIYISWYEITADEEEDVIDLIHTSVTQSNINQSSSVNDTVKTESEMQEIYVDSDSLKELIMVIEDIFNKRKTIPCQNKVLNNSNLTMRIRIWDKSENDSEVSFKELVLIDLSEINEPLKDMFSMFESLDSSISSLSLDTRICQQIFEKLRKSNTFKLLTFLENTDSKVSI